MLKTILFDLDDTLLDFHKAEAAALRKTLIQLDVEPTDAIVFRYSDINAAQWKLLEEGRATRDQVLTRRFEILFSELGIDRPSGQAREIYESFLGKGHYFISGAPEVLELLAPKYDLYIVSNGTARVQDGRIESAGIAKYFKGIFISQRIGVDKPNPEFFDRCFASVPGFSRDEAIIIGDSLTSDIKGGNNAGIRTCWFNPHGIPRREDIRADYEIARLDQLPRLLADISLRDIQSGK